MMVSKNGWLFGILCAAIMILISYLGYSIFNLGNNECGQGEKWPYIYSGDYKAAVCINTIIPHSTSKPLLYVGSIILVISIIGFVIFPTSNEI